MNNEHPLTGYPVGCPTKQNIMKEIEVKQRKATLKINQNENTGEWYWSLVAPNGNIIADNGGHDSRAMCEAGFYAVRDYLAQGMFVIEE